jgi:hypothetical protein
MLGFTPVSMIHSDICRCNVDDIDREEHVNVCRRSYGVTKCIRVELHSGRTWPLRQNF